MAEIIVSGTVRYISPDIQVSASFKKRELVVTTEEQYPQHILINFVQDKTEYLDRILVGNKVSVSVNLRGREWLDPKTNTNRYFNDIQGWKVSQDMTEPQAQAPTLAPVKEPAYVPNQEFTDDEEDDLPF